MAASWAVCHELSTTRTARLLANVFASAMRQHHAPRPPASDQSAVKSRVSSPAMLTNNKVKLFLFFVNEKKQCFLKYICV